MSDRAPLGLPIALLVLVASLTAGFVIKDRCATHEWHDGMQYRTSCYNDIFSLYFFRGLDAGAFPYVDGDGELESYDRGDLEYPVGTGLFVGAMARLVRTPPTHPDQPPDVNASPDAREFFRATAAGLAVAAVVVLVLLWLMVTPRARVLFFAGAPSLVLYAFHNWDLLAVGLVCGALYAFWRGADWTSGVLLGLGAATKLFPAVLVPVLLLARARQYAGPEASRRARALFFGGIGGFALLNVPVLLANPAGWLLPWRFQSTRLPNFETWWWSLCERLGGCNSGSITAGFWSERYPNITGVFSGLLFLAAATLLVTAEWRRPRFRPYATCFGVVLIFLITGKVFSPQFALWLLPFFVLVRIPFYAFLAFAVSEAAVWFAIAGWFLVQGPNPSPGIPVLGGSSVGDPEFRFLVVELTVLVRYLVLGWILWLTRRVDDAVETAPPEAAPAAASVQLPA